MWGKLTFVDSSFIEILPERPEHPRSDAISPEGALEPEPGPPRQTEHSKRLLRWLFTDRASGRIVIGQRPNVALWIFLATLFLGAFVRQGSASATVRVIGTASLVVWAIDEIVRGANPWRRLLGGVVLLGLCIRGFVALARHT